jgi:hypothetical protein
MDGIVIMIQCQHVTYQMPQSSCLKIVALPSSLLINLHIACGFVRRLWLMPHDKNGVLDVPRR